MDNLMFWKKKDDFGSFDPGLSSSPDFSSNNLGMPSQHQGMPNNMGMPDQNLGLPNSDPGFGAPNNNLGSPTPQPNFSNSQQPTFNDMNSRPLHETAPQGFQSTPVMPQANNKQSSNQDIELLSYKLDTIKAALEMINQRVSNIERLAMNEVQRKKGW